MRYASLLFVVFAAANPAAAQDDPKAILERAIKAHGGADKLAKLKAVKTRAKGRLEIRGGLDFTETTLAQLPGQLKEVILITNAGQQTAVTLVFNGKEGWIRTNDQTGDMDPRLVESMQNAAYLRQVARLYPLKEKVYELAILPPILVSDQPAVGFKVSSKGHKDVNLYFYKETGLLARMDYRTFDLSGMNEVREERTVLAYQEVDGLKTARRLVAYRDGNKFMEAEILEARLLDKIDDDEFRKP
jgi:hypothetical protein